jgi:Flp pilus assembly protein TadD
VAIRGKGVRVWPALVGLGAALVLLAAGPAGLGQVSLGLPGWVLPAILAGAGVVGSMVLSPLLAARVQVLSGRVERGEARQIRQVEAVGRSSRLGGELPLVRDVTSRRLLGIHAAIPLSAHHDRGLSAELPVYVPRDRDADVHAALTRMSVSGGFLLLVGPPACGKTRCASTAMQQLLSEWRILVPEGATGLAEVVDSGVDLKQTVVWLDDLHELLQSGSSGQATAGLTAALLRRLFLPGVGPVIVIATTWSDQRELFTSRPRGQSEDLYADARRVMNMADTIDVAPKFSDAEWARARKLAPTDPRIAEALVIEDRAVTATLANARDLVRRWRSSLDGYGRAVLSAAVDARRCGHPPLIPPALLEKLASRFLSPVDLAAATPTWFSEAIEHACRVERGSAPLTAEAASLGILDGYRVSDILLASAANDSNLTPVGRAVWTCLTSNADPQACFNIASTAYSKDLIEFAERAAQRGVAAGNVPSMFAMAVILTDRGELEEAKQFYRRASNAGHSDAAINLAIILHEQGELVEAEELLRRLIDAGNTAALYSLAVLLAERGDLEEAEQFYRRAVGAGAGDNSAMNNLANILRERGDLEGAEQLYRRAVDAGDNSAMNNLANILRDRGDLEEAEQLYRRAGTPEAGHNLAKILWHRGEVEEAEQLYRRAIDVGVPKSATTLANRLGDRGDLEEAEQLYRRAIHIDDTDTEPLNNLALLLIRRGELEEAEQLFCRAIDIDGADMQLLNNLAVLHTQRGELEEAEQLFRRVIDAGRVEALYNLAFLLRDRGESEEAEELLRQARNAGGIESLGENVVHTFDRDPREIFGERPAE